MQNSIKNDSKSIRCLPTEPELQALYDLVTDIGGVGWLILFDAAELRLYIFAVDDADDFFGGGLTYRGKPW